MHPDSSDGNSVQQALAEAARHRTVLDVGSRRIAKVYAESLMDAAGEQGHSEAVLEELNSLIEDIFQKQPIFEGFLHSLSFGRDRKRELIQKALGGQASKLFLNFLFVLNDHDRLGLLRAIAVMCKELDEASKGMVHVQVTTALPLPDDQRERLLQEIRQSSGVEPLPDLKVDPDILGGLIVRLGDWLYDASVRTQMNNLRHQIFERSRHEIQSRRDSFCSD